MIAAHGQSQTPFAQDGPVFTLNLAAARATAMSETRGSFTDEVMILQKLNSYGWLVSTDRDDVFNMCIARGRRKMVPL